MQDQIEFSDVMVTYQDNKPALQHITLQIPQGAQVAVVGPNGAGKSTLFKALVGLLPVREGNITIHGLSLHAHQDCVAYLPQHEEVDWRFPVTVRDVVMMGRLGHQGWFNFPSNQDNKVIRQCMEKMNVLDLSERPIGDLSGGQQQRVFLARALAQEPHILLMDEPFTGVDVVTQEVTLDLLKELKSRNVTVMVSTHDLNMARQYFERVLVLNKEMVAYGETELALTQDTIRKAFGPHLLMLNDLVLVDDCCSHDEGEEEGSHGVGY